MNSSTGISGAVVTTNINNSTITDSLGFYSFLLPAGAYNLTATSEPRFYSNSSVTITVVAGTTVMQDIELLKKETGNITGTVTTI